MQEDEKQREEQEYQSWMSKHEVKMEEDIKKFKWKIKGTGDTTKEYTVKVTKEKSPDEYYKELSEAKLREYIRPTFYDPPKKETRRTSYTKIKAPSSSVEETPNTSLLNDLFSLVWETTNNMGLPFEVLTNIELYQKSMIDADFITKFIHALNNNLIIVPIKIVNVNDLNLRTLSFPGYVIDSAIRDKFGFRMFVSFFLPSLDPDQTNQYYDKDHVFLELNTTSNSYKAMKKEILDRFKELDVEMEQVGNTLDKLVKSDPNYHKMIYDRNKSKINIDLLKTKIRDLDNKIYNLEKGVLPDELLKKNDDKFRRAKSNLFRKLLEGKDESKPGLGDHKFPFTVTDTPWGGTISTPSHNPGVVYGTTGGSFVTSPLSDLLDNDWTKPQTSIAQINDQGNAVDFITDDNSLYIDFQGEAHDIDTMTESMINTLFDADLISEKSWNGLMVLKGFI